MSKLWAITSYFRPAGYQRRLMNYQEFHKKLNVPLLTVELIFDQRPFDLQAGDAEKLVQIRGGDVMWQKERLLNIAVSHLPEECEYVAWVDCDIIFDDPYWAEKTQECLQDRALVQPFQNFCEISPLEPFAYRQHRSCLCAVEDGQLAERFFTGRNVSEHIGVNPGLAWASRRELLEACPLYDRFIIGGGDKAFICAAYGRSRDFLKAYQLDAEIWADYLAWGDRLYQAVAGNAGYVEGHVSHLYHGDISRRSYGSRYRELQKFSFDPIGDIVMDRNMCWRWGSDKPALHRHLRDYFIARQEDG